MALPRIISVDDHVVEPPHVWQTWLPEKWRERGPRVERKKWGSFKHLSGAKYDMVEDPEGEWGDAWYYDDELIYVHKKFVAIPEASVTDRRQGRPPSSTARQMTMTAITYDDMRKGCWDRDERVKDLALNYTDGSLPFPTFPRFCGQTFYEGEDKELGLACVKANNDWMVEEWCAPSGGVNIPLCLIPLWDVELAAAETKRNAERGVPGHRLQRDPDPPEAARASTPTTGTRCGRSATTTASPSACTSARRRPTRSRRPTATPPSAAPSASTTPWRRWPTGSSRATCSGSPS